MSKFSLEQIKECLLNENNPVAQRNHASFLLRTMGTLEAAEVIGEGLKNRNNSQLLRHEFAYILGQMQHKELCPLLSEILIDESEDTLVRHESAEALGALGDVQYLDILRQFSSHPIIDIAETCKIAVDLINWKITSAEAKIAAGSSAYLSVDPAPSFEKAVSIAELEKDLLDTEKSLFHRYRVMFTLRNINSDESAMALVKGFTDSSGKNDVGSYVVSKIMFANLGLVPIFTKRFFAMK
jgi:deoxyhypusine monooxygenase